MRMYARTTTRSAEPTNEHTNTPTPSHLGKILLDTQRKNKGLLTSYSQFNVSLIPCWAWGLWSLPCLSLIYPLFLVGFGVLVGLAVGCSVGSFVGLWVGLSDSASDNGSKLRLVLGLCVGRCV